MQFNMTLGGKHLSMASSMTPVISFWHTISHGIFHTVDAWIRIAIVLLFGLQKHFLCPSRIGKINQKLARVWCELLVNMVNLTGLTYMLTSPNRPTILCISIYYSSHSANKIHLKEKIETKLFTMFSLVLYWKLWFFPNFCSPLSLASEINIKTNEKEKIGNESQT